ncbi:MAG: hypothetical protein JJE25_15590 [Bacteroidia bacterium]|nr:hypothetical protein [Bacteroidia bacterium]
MQHTSEIINRFIFNIKEDCTEKQPAEAMSGQCKATTNEATWEQWKIEQPESEFSSRQIGTRMYFMIS